MLTGPPDVVVHVAELRAPIEHVVERLLPLLPSPEQGVTVRRGREGHRYAAGRLLLRAAVAAAGGGRAGSLRVAVDTNGKPYLPDRPWGVSVSHSHRMVAAAVRPSGAVGVDVEHRRRLVSPDAVALRIGAAAGSDVFTEWVLREAALKSDGGGLQTRLDSLTVAASGTDRRMSIAAHEGRVRLTGRSLDLPTQSSTYAAAVVVPGPLGPVRIREWTVDEICAAFSRECPAPCYCSSQTCAEATTPPDGDPTRRKR